MTDSERTARDGAPSDGPIPPPARMIDIDSVTSRVVVDELSPEAMEQLRLHVEEASGGGNRFVWFLIGFVAALVAGVVASIVFLAVSDEDDDGRLDLDVPNVDVSIDG